MKLTAIIQARMSSVRLPGKVLLPILEKPMLLRMVERVLQSELIEQVVVATSTLQEDNPIAELCFNNEIRCFRGDLDDVLRRFRDAAIFAEADPIVRLTADCPLIDPKTVDLTIRAFLDNKGRIDFVSNALKATYPDGLDVSVFSLNVLNLAFDHAQLRSEREHVVPWMWKHSKTLNIESKIDLSAHRWTVDEPQDLEFVKAVYGELYLANPHFEMQDVLNLLKRRPDLAALNNHIGRDEGYRKSIEKDEVVTKC